MTNEDKLSEAGADIVYARLMLEGALINAAHRARIAHVAGVPISTIARLAHVSRPTVYGWINNAK